MMRANLFGDYFHVSAIFRSPKIPLDLNPFMLSLVFSQQTQPEYEDF